MQRPQYKGKRSSSWVTNYSLNDLDELVNADRVVAVAIHEGERLVAFLDSFHLLPVQLLW